MFAEVGVPDELPIPPSATVVVVDTAHDGDDPMEGRVQVLDAGAGGVDELVAFYEASFPEADGWVRAEAPDGELMCLVRRNKNSPTEVIDLIAYNGARVDVKPGTLPRHDQPLCRARRRVRVRAWDGCQAISCGVTEPREAKQKARPLARPGRWSRLRESNS